MDKFRLTVVVLISVAVVWSMMFAGFLGIVVVALFATALTIGLKNGSLAPYYPTISRADAPAKFWTVMFACAAVVALNIINLIWKS